MDRSSWRKCRVQEDVHTHCSQPLQGNESWQYVSMSGPDIFHYCADNMFDIEMCFYSFSNNNPLSLFFLLGSCRNWRRKKERKKRSDWSSRGKEERETKSGSGRESAATAKKRRKGRGRGTRSGKETEIATVNGNENVNGKRRRSERGSGRGKGVETSVKVAADRGQWGTGIASCPL